MTLEEHPAKDTIQVESALCPSESVRQNQTIRTILLEDGKIVAAAPKAAKQALRDITNEWGLQISGMSGQNLVDHAKALDLAIRNIYTALDPDATRTLHRMHLMLLRQDRFFIAHLGVSDVYLIRERKMHPLALAPSLRKLEESLGFEFEPQGKIEPERISCGSFSWPDLPVVNLVSAGYRPGDYFLFTSPGLFEQRDWAGILGSVARASTPFDQAAVRLSRLGQARLRSETDGYLLVHVAGQSATAAAEPELPAEAVPAPALAISSAMAIEDVGHKQLRHQLESPLGFGEPRGGSGALGLSVAIVGLVLAALFVLTPYLRELGANDSAAPSKSPRTAPRGSALHKAARDGGTSDATEPRGELMAAMPRATDALEAPSPTPAAGEAASGASASAAEAEAPDAAGNRMTAERALELATASGADDPYVAGRQLVLENKLAEATVLFQELAGAELHAYTIQVGVISRPETIRRYFLKATDGTRLMLLPGKERSFLCIGLFASQKEAWAAVQRLPEFFRKQNPVVKPIGVLLAEAPPESRRPARPGAAVQP